MTELKQGDRVKFTAEIAAEVKLIPYGGGDRLTLKLIDGTAAGRQVDFWQFTDGGIGVYLDAIAVELAEPENWPPQKGDVWTTANGNEWFARTNPDEGVFLVPAASGGPIGTYYSRSLPSRTYDFKAFKALNPTLARRRGQ